MDIEIAKALADYGPKLAAAKDHPYDVSGYTVNKNWGSETWLALTEYYAFKIIKMKAGCKSSLQSHKTKVEANLVVEGQVEVFLETSPGHTGSRLYGPGQGWVVPAGIKHRVIAITDYVAIETSSPHLDDVTRYDDEWGRADGKIESEHTV